MLYEKNKEKELSHGLFENPTSEYRGTPFWAWNCELTPELLEKEIDDMKAMGFGGFHMHPRVGMSTKYLSEEYMSLVGTCVEKARKEKMLAWLYDEDKWPSGYAGGYVTKKPENRKKYLFITDTPYNDGTLTLPEDIAAAKADGIPQCYSLIACFDVVLSEDGALSSYKKIGTGEKAAGKKIFVYLETQDDDPWFNGEAYCDTLSKPVIEDFIKTTHENYKKHFGDEFGKIIPAIFTDEPQFMAKRRLSFAHGDVKICLPFTSDFEETYKDAYGESIIDRIPELVWELPDGKASTARYHYHDHVAERFVSAFADTIGKWCDENNILLTGHVMQEPTLDTQTGAVGDAMRSYRGFGLPGIDMLADRRELTTAKQAQSASHQYGREGVLSELYGVTNWTFDFRGHKLQGDWQAALGVTVRVPHLFWVSMQGEAKRDYPASIGYQSPWYKEYKYVEDHFARVNTVMTRGKPDVRVAVVHPVESYWLHYGPNDCTGTLLGELERHFDEITSWLLFGGLDFDYICESLLPTQFDKDGGGFAVGKMNYDTVIVPYCETIRATTLDALSAFASKGGKVIFMGEAPKYVDAVPSPDGKALAEKCTFIPWSRSALYRELEEYRTIALYNGSGEYTNKLIYQSRIDGDKRNIFISHVYKPKNYDTAGYENYVISIPGEYKVTEYDTLTGDIRPLPAKYHGGKTNIEWKCGACSSLLISLEKGKYEDDSEKKTVSSFEERLRGCVDYELEEPNVLLLDAPAYSINGGEIQPSEYILFADDRIREKLGLSRRAVKMVQPWVKPYDKNPKDKVSLYYSFESDIDVPGCRLALESYEYAEVVFNGEKVDMTPVGYYVDEDAIKTFDLPPVRRGKNELTVNYRFGEIVQLESCFILGNFGVELAGSNMKITGAGNKLGYDDITTQGLVFYGGNITYKTDYLSDGEGEKFLVINKYRGSLIGVSVDGARVGVIAYPPYRLSLGRLSAGNHKIELTLFGNRMNTFGVLHNTDEDVAYCSPHRWRDEGEMFVREYLVRETGILSAPRIITEK